jgi:hypothetical protein
MILKIGKKELTPEVRPPSKFYRSQYSKVAVSLLGVTDKLKAPVHFIEQLDEDGFKAVLKCCCDITFEDLDRLDLNQSENYENATKIMNAFFLALYKTIKK